MRPALLLSLLLLVLAAALPVPALAQVNPNQPKPKPASPQPKPAPPAPAATVAVQVEWQGSAPVKATIGGQEVTLLPGTPATVRLKPDLHTVAVATPANTYKAADYLAVQGPGHLTLRLEGSTVVMRYLSEADRKAAERAGQQALAELDGHMVRVAGGSFTMGCTGEQGSDCSGDEKPAHRVTVGTFLISKYEVTQALWAAVMGDAPSHFKDCGQCPVESVSWEDAQAFISKLNARTGKRYRLPTEAEWEYAARGGSQSRGTEYAGSNDLVSVGWYKGNSGGKTHPVGQKAANELGLYDMSGNVWEWCSDWYGKSYYGSSPSTDPSGPSSGEYRVVRGGSWSSTAANCRVALRGGSTPDDRYYRDGFRLARTE